MGTQAYDPEFALNHPLTLAVATELACLDGTQGAPTRCVPPLDLVMFRAEGERMAQKPIMGLYLAPNCVQNALDVEGIPVNFVFGAEDVHTMAVTMAESLDDNEDKIMPLTPVSRASSVVVAEPEIFPCIAIKDGNRPPPPRRSTRILTLGSGCGRVRSRHN